MEKNRKDKVVLKIKELKKSIYYLDREDILKRADELEALFKEYLFLLQDDGK